MKHILPRHKCCQSSLEWHRKRFMILIFVVCVTVFFATLSNWNINLAVGKIRVRHFHNTSGDKNSMTIAAHETSMMYMYSHCDDIEHTYLTVNSRPWGGLGNSLFRMATVYGISRATNRTPVVMIDSPVLKHFNVNLTKMTKWKFKSGGVKEIKEASSGIYTKSLYDISQFCENVAITGYLQSWKYFVDVETDFRKVLTFKNSIVKKAVHFFDQITLPMRIASNYDLSYIGLHVRRGDFLTKKRISMGYGVPQFDYFQRAIALLKHKYPRHYQVFIVSTNDIRWTKTNFKKLQNVTLIYTPKSNDAGTDLAILSMCNHTIISSGTFGWWSAFFANGTTIYYKNYPRPGSTLAQRIHHEDYYFPHWIPLE